MDDLSAQAPLFDDVLFGLIHRELDFQNTTLNLTAACNFLSPQIGSAMHAALNNIHCEGYPGKRYHEGQHNADAIEQLAIRRARKLFNADHANVQPYRGTMANVAACLAASNCGDTILGFECEAGGHFTTGSKIHLTNRLFKVETYGLDRQSNQLDYDQIEQKAQALRPAIVFAGDTAFPGLWRWQKLKDIADSVGAALVVDISQTAGLIVSGAIESPVPVADIVTMATYKTLRGPRAGLIVCKSEYQSRVDRAVFPVCQDGTNIMQIAGLAAALFEAAQPSFKLYCERTLNNAHELATALGAHGFRLVTGGTRNHACLIDLSAAGFSGREAAAALAQADIICNANQIPFDAGPPTNPSGLRVGTAAITTLGMGNDEMNTIAGMIRTALDNIGDAAALALLRDDVRRLRARFRESAAPTPPFALNNHALDKAPDHQS